jgi:hypothetical protein
MNRKVNKVLLKKGQFMMLKKRIYVDIEQHRVRVSLNQRSDQLIFFYMLKNLSEIR